MKKVITLGSKVRVSDPCYSPDTWCSLLLNAVKPGKYHVNVEHIDDEDWGRRNAKLTAIHEDYVNAELVWERHSDIGVDSGQAGIFDEVIYRDDENAKSITYASGGWFGFNITEPGDVFYDKMCGLTLNSPDQWGTFEQGVVSRSGIGDGGYPVLLAYNEEDVAVGICIDFWPTYDEEEEQED